MGKASAKSLRAKGELEESNAACRKAVSLAPQSANAHLQLGFTLLKQRQLDEAIAECKIAVEYNKTSGRYHFVLGLCYETKGRFDQAIEEYKESLRLEPKGDVAPSPYPGGPWRKAGAESRGHRRISDGH